MYVPLYPLESILTFNIGTLCSLPRDTHFSLERVRKIDHMRPQGFERPCRKAIFTRSIFCRSLSGTAGPLRYRKHLINLVWKCSTILPNYGSDSCAKSDTRFCPWNSSVGLCCLNGVALIQVSFGVQSTVSHISLTYFTTYCW